MSNTDTSHDASSTPPDASSTPPFRYTASLAQAIELRWQDRWEENGTFETPNPSGPLGDAELLQQRGPKLFINDMFPYPSGAGLHVGHPLGFIGTDVYGRFKRMTGYNVLHTMGFDAFGLPAEQYAVEHGVHPAVTTNKNIETYRRQLRRLGVAHDQRRSVSTTDPEYYRWTQWIFSQIFNAWFDPEAGQARPIEMLEQQFESGHRAAVTGPASQHVRVSAAESDAVAWGQLTRAEQRRILDSYRLAYVSDAPVNWCPGLGTVVANEEVTADNRSDRGNFPVFKRSMRQWMMRITDYADRLLDDLEVLDWTDGIKALQRNWIGRSVGADVVFDSPAGSIKVFTTRPDTLFGATFMVLSPEHPYVAGLTTSDQADAIRKYQTAAAAKTEIDRTDDSREKTGVFTGSYAINPLTGEQIPVWIADYVLMGYGTGAIMAVPAGDTRDFDFARQFGLPIRAIQQPPADWFAAHGIEPQTGDAVDTATWPQAFVGDAVYINSSNDDLDLNGIDNTATAITATNDWLEAAGRGKATVIFKLRDWLFSRQRYWGEPFPIVYDDDGNPHTVPDDLLPVTLPDTDSFSPTTFDPQDAESDPEAPLSRLDDWVDVTLDLGAGPKTYRRDPNVMPQWAGSCWYQLRYADPTNDAAFIDPEIEKYWVGPQPDQRPDHPGGVDLYVGGVEHAVLHLLYSRFWHKVLYDLGHLSSKEPYARLYNQGYVQAFAYTDDRGIYVEAREVEPRDGGWYLGDQPVNREYGKIGKSLKNAVSPDEMYDTYGADTFRLYEMATGPLDKDRPWNTDDVVGQFRLLQRLWRNLVDETTGELIVTDTEPDLDTLKVLHRTIADMGAAMDDLKFNTAIAKFTELNNAVTKLDSTPRSVADTMVRLIAPLAPHIAEELWAKLGHVSDVNQIGDADNSIMYVDYPIATEQYLVDDTVEYPVQVNGKVRGHIEVAVTADRDTVTAAALADDKVIAAIDGAPLKKVIVVPGRMVNIVV